MKRILIILISIAFLYGCGDDHAEELTLEGEISVSSDNILFNSSAVSTANLVTVTSSSDWRLSGDKTWCTPSSVEGKSGDLVSFTAQVNDTGEPRSNTYTFMCGSRIARLVVTQSQNDVIEFVTDKSYEVESAASEISVRLNTNINLTINIPEDSGWITDAYAGYSTRSVEQNWLCFKVAANTTYKARSGKIILSGEGMEDQEIMVYQAQNDAVILGTATYNVSPSGTTLTVDVQSNVPYTVSIPAARQSWITRTSQTGSPLAEGLNSFQETFEIGAATVTRVAQITFAGGAASTVAIVMQLSANPLFTTIPDANFRNYLKLNDYIAVLDEATGRSAVTGDGEQATSFAVSSKTIYSLTGIEAFQGLKTLSCSSNYITELDLSHNTTITSLTCSYNKLNKLILGDNNITSLSFSTYTLRNPDMEYSTGLTVAANKLRTFTCSSIYVTTLDMSECPGLTSLNCSSASALATLYLKESQEANLTTFRKHANTTVVYR